MTEVNEQNWYVLRTRPRQEKAVRKLLTDIGVENFLPTSVEEHEYVNQRKKKIEVPLITSTCFMRCAAADRLADGLCLRAALSVRRFNLSNGGNK